MPLTIRNILAQWLYKSEYPSARRAQKKKMVHIEKIMGLRYDGRGGGANSDPRVVMKGGDGFYRW